MYLISVFDQDIYWDIKSPKEVGEWDSFYRYYLAALQPILSHLLRDSLTNLVSISAFRGILLPLFILKNQI